MTPTFQWNSFSAKAFQRSKTSCCPPVTYRVSILPELHELQIEMRLDPPVARRSVQLEVPSWVPGSYHFHPFGRNIFDVRAWQVLTGEPLRVVREGWQGYRVEGATGALVIAWRVWAYDLELSQVFGMVDQDFAVITGVNLLHPSAWRGVCRVIYDVPPGWQAHYTSGEMPGYDDTSRDYPNYETLLDSPVVLGRWDRVERRLDGTTFYFVFLDRTLGFETESRAFVDRLAGIAYRCRDVFGFFPFTTYTFIFTTRPDLRWGLEHLTSSVCGLGPDVFIDPGSNARGLRVAAHELFHAWNVRRLRPAPFGQPMDLRHGTFTEGLWLAEGFTRYYEFLLCTRAGIYTPEQFFSSIVNNWDRLRRSPAYSRISATDSSLATFLNHRSYPGFLNTSIDYYQKGMLIAFDLDAELRLAGDDSLDAALRDFYRAFAESASGYTTADALTFFGRRRPRAGRMLERAVTRGGGLATREHLERLGFALEPEVQQSFGFVVRPPKLAAITGVSDRSSAARAGLAPGDVITRINGFPVTSDALRWAAGTTEPVALEGTRGHRPIALQLVPQERKGITALRWRGCPADLIRIREWCYAPDFAPEPGEQLPLSFYEDFRGVDEHY